MCNGKSLVVTKRLLTPKKVLLEPKKHIFDRNSHFFCPEQPSLVWIMVIYSLNKFLTWHFCSISAILARNALFWPRKCSLVSKRAYFHQYQPFLIVFFTKKLYFAVNSHFLVQESPCWSLKGLFWPKKAVLGCFFNFDPIVWEIG